VVQQLSERERAERWSKITAHAWEDPSFKQQLLSNPKPVLKDSGLEIPDNFTVRIVEQGTSEGDEVGHYQLSEESRGQYSLVMRLPNKPAEGEGELSEAQLESVAGGWSFYTCCSCCPCCSC